MSLAGTQECSSRSEPRGYRTTLGSRSILTKCAGMPSIFNGGGGSAALNWQDGTNKHVWVEICERWGLCYTVVAIQVYNDTEFTCFITLNGTMNYGFNFWSVSLRWRSWVDSQTICSGCRGWCGCHCWDASLFWHWMTLWRHSMPPRCVRASSSNHPQQAHWKILQTTGRVEVGTPSTHWNGVRPVNEGVLGIFGPGKVPTTALLTVLAVGSQEPIELLIQSVCLAIRLLVITWGETDIDIKSFAKAFLYLGCELDTLVWNPILWEIIELEDFSEEDFSVSRAMGSLVFETSLAGIGEAVDDGKYSGVFGANHWWSLWLRVVVG